MRQDTIFVLWGDFGGAYFPNVRGSQRLCKDDTYLSLSSTESVHLFAFLPTIKVGPGYINKEIPHSEIGISLSVVGPERLVCKA